MLTTKCQENLRKYFNDEDNIFLVLKFQRLVKIRFLLEHGKFFRPIWVLVRQKSFNLTPCRVDPKLLKF